MDLMTDENSPEGYSSRWVLHRFRITDLKPVCLEYILWFLDFTDLVNVAESNVRLKELASLVFAEKYCGVTFAIQSDRINVHSTQSPFISTASSPLESVGTFFKHFGQLIPRLAIFGSDNEFYSQWVEHCVAKYCADTLVEIFFYNHMSGTMMSELKKPFPLIESVTIIQSHLSQNVSQLNVWFPRMRSLKLIDNVAANGQCIEEHFPQLQTLVIWLHGSRRNGFTKANLIEIIRLNPNISDLWLQFYSFPVNLDELQLDQDLCRLIAVNLRELDRFVWAPDGTTLQNCDRITFKKARHFVSEAPVLHFMFKQLEELELRRIRTPINEMIDFVCRNKKLSKLKITLDFMNLRQASSDQVNKIAKNLPKLNELVLDWRIFIIDDIIKFLYMCKSLMRLHLVNMADRVAHVGHQIAQKNIDPAWKIVKSECDFVFKRRI